MTSFIRLNDPLMAYPVGSIYMSVSPTSPEDLFGGRWERIQGRFLLAATDGGAAGGNSNASIAAGGTGGEASHALTAAESGLRDHTHGFKQPTVKVGYQTSGASGSARYTGSAWSSKTNDFQASVSGGAVEAVTGGAQAATSAHNNMPPYLAVYVWKRTE